MEKKIVCRSNREKLKLLRFFFSEFNKEFNTEEMQKSQIL
jgi:hypothetical protein